MTVTIENLYTGNGSATDYSFTFPYLDTTDIKVSLDGVATTAYSLLNATTVRFDSAPGNGVAIRIYRDTAFENPKATFYPGSAIRANDLNDNTLQNLYVNHESNWKVDRAWITGDPTVISTESWYTTDDTKIATTKAIEGRIDSKITSFRTTDVNITGNIAVSGTVDGRDVAADGTKLDGIATSANNYTHPNHTGDVTSSGDGALTIAADAVTSAKIADNSINSEHYVDGSIDVNHLSGQCVTGAKIAAATIDINKMAANSVGTTQYVDGSIQTVHLEDAAVTEAKLGISNTGSNGQFLQKQSGNTGGLTWASSINADGTTGIDFNDSVNIRFGADNDLQIFHNGDRSKIQNSTGELRLCSNTIELKNYDDDETFITTADDGAVELYYDGVKHFETHPLGIKVIGVGAGTAQIDIQPDQGDNNADKWKVGATDNGHFFISNKDSGAWDTNIECNRSGNVELYYDGLKTFETQAHGVTVTDDDTSVQINMVNSSGTAGYLYGNGTTDFGLLDGQGHYTIKGIKDGAVELYYDGVKTLATESTGITILGAEGGDASIHIYSDEGDDNADKIRIRKPAASNLLTIEGHNGTAWEDIGRFNVGGGAELYYDGVKKLETATDKINFHAHAKVNADNTYDLGASGARWKDVFISNDIDIIDDGKILLGTADDLQIYHSSNDNSYIQNATGQLRIKGNAIRLRGYTEDDMMISTDLDGAVALAYDGVQRFETTANGAKVTGKLLVDGAVEYDAFSSSSIHVDGYICMGRTDTTVAQDNSIAGFRFYSNDTNINSGNFLNVATIDINADGDFLSGDAPTNMVFKTMKDGTTTLTEAFRLDSNQNATFAGSLDIAGAIDENAFTITDASSVALDPDNGTIQIWNLTANRTATDSFTAGQSMLLMISDGTSNTITWPTMTWVGGSAPTLATSGATCIELWKVGSTLYGSHVGDVA